MDWINLAKEVGFEAVCPINMESLCPMQEVRDMCAADKCRAYGKRWVCPPGCGSIEHCRDKISHYSGGILVQTVGSLQDEFDLEGIDRAQKTHDKRFKTLARQVRYFEKDCLPLSAGTCTRCEVCTYPDKPCRYPDKILSSMEAYGLLVSDVCTKSGMPYYRGENTITFTSCILIDREERSK